MKRTIQGTIQLHYLKAAVPLTFKIHKNYQKIIFATDQENAIYEIHQ